MLRSVVTVAVLGLFACPVLAQDPTGSSAESASWVSTNGVATLDVPPDVAFVQMASEARARKTVDAQKLATDAMTTLLGALKALGLPSAAVTTKGYTLQTEFDHVGGDQTFRDYMARNTIDVRVDDLSKLPGVIDAAGTSGASVVSGLRFDLKDRSTVEHDLLGRAVEDAMTRAQALAAGAHRSLGAIVRITEQRNLPPAYVNYDAFGGGGGRGGSSPTPISPSEVQVRAVVSLVVQLR